MDKENVNKLTHNVVLPSVRKKEILPFVTSVNPKDIMASEINQKEIL